ncbi:probable LRR receptor-like serine/threonine-protein kinase, partial [Tanacetum coccineum]
MRCMTIGINGLLREIPSELGRLTDLRELHVIRNYIDNAGFSGEIPPTFANLSSMVTVENTRLYKELGTVTIIELVLGNNSLNGTLPDEKSASLNNIDLSYNELLGTLPSWVNAPNLQINLVVNNFTLKGSENRRIQVKDIVKEVEDYLKTYLSAGMDILA